MKALATAVVVLGAACGNSICVDLVCADPDETRTFAGPCTSRYHFLADDDDGGDVIIDGTFDYDAAGNLTRVVTSFHGPGAHEMPVHTVSATQWSYDPSGAVSAIDGPDQRWTFDSEHVTATYNHGVTALYDRATFAFLPLAGRDHRVSPGAALGLIREDTGGGIETYTWTRAGQTLTATSTFSGDGATGTTVYELDDRGRIASWRYTNPYGDVGTQRYEFDGDRLIRETSGRPSQVSDDRRYVYDRGGNLIKVFDSRAPAAPEVFAYDCWN